MSADSLWHKAQAIWRHPAFKLGVKDLSGTSLGIAAWGLVTGVAMVKSGMSVWLAVFMTFTVYAGSAQLAVLPLMAVGAPLWVIWFTALCVNLRFVILSAMWRRFFESLSLRHRMAIGYFSGDVIFVAFAKRYPAPGQLSEQMPYFWGAAAVNWVTWQIPLLAGVFLADQVPLEWGLGFAGVLALLGVLYSMLKQHSTRVACLVAAVAAVAAFSLPLKLNILVAIACAVAVGLLMETAERRAAGLRSSPVMRAPDPERGEKYPVLPLDADEERR